MTSSTTTKNMKVENLEKNGYIVLQKPSSYNLEKIQKRFKRCLKRFRVFKKKSNEDSIYVLGGFSALGNPGSFHNPFVRDVREWQMYEAITHLFSHPLYNKYRLEKFFDRMVYRKPGFSPSAESWHRDECPLAKETDKTFGGWTNFSFNTQYFSCVPGSHKEASGHAGFSKIPKSERKKYKDKSVKVSIKPGEQLVFYENIVHEVNPKKYKDWQMRVHCGFRLTKDKKSIQPDLKNIIKKQGVPKLKSLQTPPMYALLHWTNWRPKIVAFSQLLLDVVKEEKILKSGKNAGDKYFIVHRYMKSLEDYNLKKYPKYTKHQKRIFYPHKKWLLLKPGKKKKRIKITLK
jgi:hypothetical protein